MPKPGGAAGSKKGVKAAKVAKAAKATKAAKVSKAAKNGGDQGNEPEFVTVTIHRDCAKDFLSALNLALGGLGAKEAKGKYGTKGSRKPK